MRRKNVSHITVNTVMIKESALWFRCTVQLGLLGKEWFKNWAAFFHCLLQKQIQQEVWGLSSVSISRALMICILMITSGGKLDLCY